MSGILSTLIVALIGLALAGLVVASWALVLQYTFDAHYLRVKFLGLFSVHSIPYDRIVETKIIPWWEQFTPQLLWAEPWPSHVFNKKCVLVILDQNLCKYVFLSPQNPHAFVEELAAQITRRSTPLPPEKWNGCQ